MLTLLRAKDCAKAASVCDATWWAWVREGLAPQGHKISQQITVWRSDEVEEFLNHLVPRRIEQ
jgi:predicted DNA-binding transcriptional regulator AlpA